MKRYYCLVLFLLSFLSTKAINPPFLYYLGIENGLSNNAVTSIYQDNFGFMWFGTYEGLNRYDGYKFEIFRNDPNDSSSLTDNRIVAIQEDNHHNLIIGTKKGANIYHAITRKFHKINFQADERIQTISAAINGLAKDKTGNVYLATDGQGLLVYGNKGNLATQVIKIKGNKSSNSYHVQSVKIDNHQNIWIYTQEYGLCRYNSSNHSIIPLKNLGLTVHCMETDPQGNIWIGTENGLYRYQIETQQLIGYQDRKNAIVNSHIFDLYLDKRGQLWIGTDGAGIGIYDSQNDKLEQIQAGKEAGMLTSSAVNTFYEDTDHRIWIGTLRGGINIIDQHKARFKTISSNPFKPNTLISNFILSFSEDQQGNVWIGTDGEGISYWNRKNNSFRNYSHSASIPGTLTSNNIAGILRDSANDIWVTTYGGGVNKYNPATGSFKYYPCVNTKTGALDRNTWSIYEDRLKNLWVGTCTDGALYCLNRQSDKFEVFDPNLKNVLTIAEDKKGRLWMGTFSSIILVDPKHKKHRFYNLNAAVRAIHEDKSGNFWIGTEGAGLLKFDRKKGTYQAFSQKDGLPSNAILNILEDESGHLWISTFNGLSRFTPRTLQFKNFYESDGLQSKQFNYNAALKLRSGEFLFGGIKGFNLFRPEEIKAYEPQPKLMVTALRTNNIPYEQDEAFEDKKSVYEVTYLTLPYDKAVLSVDFAALEYSSANKIAYSYYLEGWDANWNDAGNTRTINYSKLREGNYTLRIKSTDAEGKWLNNEKTIHIKVLPPWWRSYWAYFLYISGFSGIIYIYLNYQKRQTALKYQIDLANLKVEQEKELSEKKLSFFTNVSHEFRTPLTLIINPLKELLNSSRQIDVKELTVVYRNARRLLSLVDQLLLFRKSDAENMKITKTNIVAFGKEVYFCFGQQAKVRNINFLFSTSAEQIEVYIDKEKMEISLYNLIANAFKFTQDQGTIEISIDEQQNSVELHVKDNGTGISEEVGDKLFDRFYQVFEKSASAKTGFGLGLYLVNKFMKLHHGKVKYTSQPMQGTDFVLVLMKGNSHFGNQQIYEESNEAPFFVNELITETEDEGLALVEHESPTEITIEKPQILIVDDNKEIKNYIAQLFNQKYLVYEAESAEEALEKVKNLMPDIVLTDVVMGGMSGVELCTAIKEDPALSHIPVILLTSSSSPEIKLQGIESGADDHITKPFDKDILIARVANLIKNRNTLQNYFFNEITLQSDNSKVSQEDKDFLEKCISITESHLDDPEFNIKILADEIGMSHSALYKKVKAISGKTINEFIRYIKLRKAAQLFIHTDHNVSQVAFEAGFTDIKYFREQFHKLFGMRPSEYTKKYRKSFGNGHKLDQKITKNKA